jgi:hypothetical protein
MLAYPFHQRTVDLLVKVSARSRAAGWRIAACRRTASRLVGEREQCQRTTLAIVLLENLPMVII